MLYLTLGLMCLGYVREGKPVDWQPTNKEIAAAIITWPMLLGMKLQEAGY
jgi:hypothetical protein